jgi:hypothetical protein
MHFKNGESTCMENESESVGPLIIIALIGVAAFIESIGIELVRVFTVLGLLFLKLMGGFVGIFISYHLLRILFMGITKLKERIDSIFEWKNSVDEKIERLDDISISRGRDVRQLEVEQENILSLLEQIQADIVSIQEHTGLLDKNSVNDASSEILSEFI